jgi:hypothetical protein
MAKRDALSITIVVAGDFTSDPEPADAQPVSAETASSAAAAMDSSDGPELLVVMIEECLCSE